MCTVTVAGIVLIWFLDDGLKTPVEVLSILDHQDKKTEEKKGLYTPNFAHR